MTKKEYVFKVLDKVRWSWEKESVVRDYLTKHEDSVYVDYLYDKFTKAVKVTLENQSKEKIQSLSKHLNELKNKESESYQADHDDLTKLDDLLTNM